jgi:hypothetical protein
MSEGDELKFEGGAATEAEREHGNDGGKNRTHGHDCMAAAQKSLGLPDIWSFEQAQPFTLKRAVCLVETRVHAARRS